MQFPQTSVYGYAPPVGMPGDIIDNAPHLVRTFKANGAIPFGCAVVHTVADDDNLVTVPPTPGADADSIIITGPGGVGAATGGIQIFVPDGGAGLIFDGARAGKVLQYGYLLELVCNNHADWNLTTAEVWGLDVAGVPQYDTFSIADLGNATILGNLDSPIVQVTRFELPAQAGAGNAYFTLGNQAAIGQVNAIGIAVRNKALQDRAADGYVDGEEVQVLTFGRIWVRPTGVASGSVYSGQRATIRATAGGGERQGEISNVVDGGDNAYWPRGKFLDDALVYHATTNPYAVVPLEVG